MSNRSKRLPDRLPQEVWDELRHLYLTPEEGEPGGLGLSQHDIAKRLDLHPGTVYYRLQRLGIIRERSAAQRLHFKRHPRTKLPPKKYNRRSVRCRDCMHKFYRYLDVEFGPEMPKELIPEWPAQPYILAKPCPRCGGMIVPVDFCKIPKHAFTRAQARQMAYYYVERKWSTTQIADHFYCCPSTVLLYLNRQGVNTHRYTVRRDTPSFQRTCEMYELYWGYNWSTTEIAKEYNLAPSAIISRFKRAGFPMRSHGETLRLKNRRIKRQRERKEQEELAKAA